MMSMAINSFAQAPVSFTATGNEKPLKIETHKVPSIIVGPLSVEFPDISAGNWYTHPVFNSKSNWYVYNPNIKEYEHPENYAIMFVKENVLYKVVYNKVVEKLATHKGFNSELSKAVSESIAKSEFSS
jgi:hypothetical protein